MDFIITCPRNTEDLLTEEIAALGGADIHPSLGMVSYAGPLESAYRLCLWSRTANRVLLPLSSFSCTNRDDLYYGVSQIDWSTHMSPESTIAIDGKLTNAAFDHSHFAAQVVKDAVADQFRHSTGKRPAVDPDHPQIRLSIYINRDRATLSLDLSGDSLHRRGYRHAPGPATLKENVAAAVLLRAGWPEIARAGGGLVDLFCGTGTLLIEGALMASDTAPGLYRSYYGFLGWKQHNSELWEGLVREAADRRTAGTARLKQQGVKYFGYDSSGAAVESAGQGVHRAKMDSLCEVRRTPLSKAAPPAGQKPGLAVGNPPYGKRLGPDEDLTPLYHETGEVLKTRFQGWEAAIITGEKELLKATRLKAEKINNLYNGSIACALGTFRLFTSKEKQEAQELKKETQGPLSERAQMLANRLKKNRKRLKPWIKKEAVSCYCLYDADMPEYAFAVDVYEETYLHVQEYAPPETLDQAAVSERRKEALRVFREYLGYEDNRIFLKVRKRQKGKQQYGRYGEESVTAVIHEGGLKFRVNFTDYLDTGIFLDHRKLRAKIGKEAKGKRFLNLFCYTGTATVHAAAGGASESVSVDTSGTYLGWTKENLTLNGLSLKHHRTVEMDAAHYLTASKERFDIIMLDPPTFSNSKDRREDFVIQRDHGELIRLAAARLTKGGTLYFSTNFRKFTLETAGLEHLRIEEITDETVSPDFERRKRSHRCWRIQQQGK